MSTVHRQQEQHSFNENSPRPPVPGEETLSVGGSQSPSWNGLRYKGGGSPVLTPRRSSLTTHFSQATDVAPLGFEPEGCCLRPPSHESCNSPPAYLRWARHLHSLLEDSEGVELFRKYLDQEGRNHSDTLNFWFACQGLKKQTDPDTISQLVKVIYRRYFQKTQLAIPEELRREVHWRVKEGKAFVKEDVFDAVQTEVERLINQTTYPNFLKSDMYLHYVQQMQGETSTSGTSSGSSSAREVVPGMLATLHEDAELVTTPPTCQPTSSDPLPLTRDMLMATQKRRASELRPKPEAYAGLYLQHAPSHPGLGQSHAPYSSYNPVSRQDSELQSLSSDARTESDNMSLTDSSVDGVSLGRSRLSKKQYARNCKQMRESASMNRDPYMHHTVIPRTQRIQKDQVHAMSPVTFAAILRDKLEGVRRDREAQEKLGRLMEGDCPSEPIAPPRSLAEAIREKLQDEDDNDQDILDQHVSRVWSDLTPLPSPGLSSPRPKSPDTTRAKRLQVAARATQRHASRKDKDVFSTFSSDSGNVHDFPEGSEHKHHLPKSKSMPDYQHDMHSLSASSDARLSRLSRRSSSKKTLTDTTDSGVSVVSDSSRPQPLPCKDSRVLTWLLESHDPSNQLQPARHSSSGGSRSKQPERPETSGAVSWAGPAQPFVADPSMPPLPLPHTATQLEEARRRLMEEEGRSKTRQRFGMASCKPVEMPTSAQSTLRKSSRAKPAPHAEEFTTVVFSFCDEQFPYRTKIPGRFVTLRQFKEFLPKKGSYRFFFKTECDDLDTRVIQEEITEDNDILPLWEGKVMAQVKLAVA